MPNSPSGSRSCRSPNSRERAGTTAIRSTCSAASSRWYRGRSLFQFEKQRLLDPLGMTETAFYVADEAKRPRIAEPMPDDRFSRPFNFGRRISGITSPTLPRRWESGGAGMVGNDRATTRASLQMLLNGGKLDGRRYLKPETVALMASDHIGPETRIVREPFLFSRALPAASALALPCAPRCRRIHRGRWANIAGTAPPARSSLSIPRTICSLIFMVQAPSQRGRIQLALKTLIYEALEK